MDRQGKLGMHVVGSGDMQEQQEEEAFHCWNDIRSLLIVAIL